jgi:hypothetical protein
MKEAVLFCKKEPKNFYPFFVSDDETSAFKFVPEQIKVFGSFSKKNGFVL